MSAGPIDYSALRLTVREQVLTKEIARLTERCDAYREAVDSYKIGVLMVARFLHEAQDDESGRWSYSGFAESLVEFTDKLEAALASPAGEQKDKTT